MMPEDTPDDDGARRIGVGVVTGAANVDPSALGTYASTGAALGPGFLWLAPITLPLNVTVVYLASKLGQVSGQGLFAVIRRRYSRWILYPALVTVIVANTISVAADLRAMAAAVRMLIPVPVAPTVVAIAVVIITLQIFGSYALIRNIFRWLAMVLLAYVAAALLSRPDPYEVVIGTLVPRISFDRDVLTLLVAVIGTSMSAYLIAWQPDQEVEEEIEHGRRRLADRVGATPAELRRAYRDIVLGMGFSNLIMYSVILATASTLFRDGAGHVETIAQAASALAPAAGRAAAVLFTVGIIAVGFLAIPVMTIGAACAIAQTFEWRHGISKRFRQAHRFYNAIIALTAIAVAIDFVGVDPVHALVWSGVAQGFATPLLLLITLMLTNSRDVMGESANGRVLKSFGIVTTAATFIAAASLLISWIS